MTILGRSHLLTIIRDSFILDVVGAPNFQLCLKLWMMTLVESLTLGSSQMRTLIQTLINNVLVLQIITFCQYFRYYYVLILYFCSTWKTATLMNRINYFSESKDIVNNSFIRISFDIYESSEFSIPELKSGSYNNFTKS